jgi:hypothetical protein
VEEVQPSLAPDVEVYTAPGMGAGEDGGEAARARWPRRSCSPRRLRPAALRRHRTRQGPESGCSRAFLFDNYDLGVALRLSVRLGR